MIKQRQLEAQRFTATLLWLVDEIKYLCNVTDDLPIAKMTARTSLCFDLLIEAVQVAESNPAEFIPEEIWGSDGSQIENFRSTCRSGAKALSSVTAIPNDLRQKLSLFADSEPFFQRGRYLVTRDMFSARIQEWQVRLSDLVGRRRSFLEVGCAAGLATCWLLDNVLTHPESSITCVDVFPPTQETLFDKNIRLTGAAHKVIKNKGKSEDILGCLDKNSFDAIYVDGSHLQEDVLADAVLSWRLLKEDGLMIFDDYNMKDFFKAKYINPERPDIGIDAFLSAYQESLTILGKGNQVFVRKSVDSNNGLPILNNR